MKSTTLSAKEAAKYLGLSYWKLLDMTKKAEIPYVSVGRLKLFRQSTLDLWLADKENSSIKPDVPYTCTGLRKIIG